jgi:hypothetical protein
MKFIFILSFLFTAIFNVLVALDCKEGYELKCEKSTNSVNGRPIKKCRCLLIINENDASLEDVCTKNNPCKNNSTCKF